MITIKGGSRRAEKSRKVLMMMKAATLSWGGQELEPGKAGLDQEQGRSRAGAEQK